MEACQSFSYDVTLWFCIATIGLGYVATTLFLLSKTGADAPRRGTQMLQEKEGPNAGDASFARVAGTLGSLTLSALFVAAVFWSHHALYCGAPGDIDRVRELGPVFLVGSALFAPYAFNRLSMVFGTRDAG